MEDGATVLWDRDIYRCAAGGRRDRSFNDWWGGVGGKLIFPVVFPNCVFKVAFPKVLFSEATVMSLGTLH